MMSETLHLTLITLLKVMQNKMKVQNFRRDYTRSSIYSQTLDLHQFQYEEV